MILRNQIMGIFLYPPVDAAVPAAEVKVLTQLLNAGECAVGQAHIFNANAHTEQQQTLDIDPVYFAVGEAAYDEVATVRYGNRIDVRAETQETALGHQLILEQ